MVEFSIAATREGLSHRQRSELDRLIRDPSAYVGSCTNPTMNALKRRGLTEIEWTNVPGSPYRKEKWVVTEAGRRAGPK